MAIRLLTGTTVFLATSVTEAWKTGNPAVTKAVAEQRIAGARAAVNGIDQAAVSDDHAFTALFAVQILLGHAKSDSTMRYLGVAVEDASKLAERTEV